MTQENTSYLISPDRMKQVLGFHQITDSEDMYAEIYRDGFLTKHLFDMIPLVYLIDIEHEDISKDRKFQMHPAAFAIINWYLHQHTNIEPIMSIQGVPRYVKARHIRNIGKVLIQTDESDRQKIDQRFRMFCSERDLEISSNFWFYVPKWQRKAIYSEQNQSILQRFASFCLMSQTLRIRTGPT